MGCLKPPILDMDNYAFPSQTLSCEGPICIISGAIRALVASVRFRGRAGALWAVVSLHHSCRSENERCIGMLAFNTHNKRLLREQVRTREQSNGITMLDVDRALTDN